jgi:hypothetical protein
MIICGSHMSEFSVRKYMEAKQNNNDKRRTLIYLPTLIVKEVKISLESRVGW